MIPLENDSLDSSLAIPQLALSIWRDDLDKARKTALEAFKSGYRAIDVASAQNCEIGLGEAIKEAYASMFLPRKFFFISGCMNYENHGYDSTLKSVESTLKHLGLNYLDLYLISAPNIPEHLYQESWRALLRLREEGMVRGIGVRDFTVEQIEHLIMCSGEKPAVNQIEIHPYRQRSLFCIVLKSLGIQIAARTPLGSGPALSDPLFLKLCFKHRKTPSQIILRWHIDRGHIALPHAGNTLNLRESLDLYDFRLALEDMRQIALLNKSREQLPRQLGAGSWPAECQAPREIISYN